MGKLAVYEKQMLLVIGCAPKGMMKAMSPFLSGSRPANSPATLELPRRSSRKSSNFPTWSHFPKKTA
jgi:hypothetical protein